MSGVVHLLQWVTFSAVASFAVLVAIRVTKLAVRRNRAALREVVARPLIDSVRVDAAIHGLRSASSDDLSIAMHADAAAREFHTSLALDADPLSRHGETRAS